MSNAELLTAISDMLEQKLEEKLEEKLEQKLDQKLDQKLQPVICRIDQLEETLLSRIESIEAKVERLEARVERLEIDMENVVIPRLSLIEKCYLDTYERYQKGVDRLDQMQLDIDVIKITVTGHSEEINKFTGPYLVK